MRREYGESALITADGPFAGGMIRAERALCPDGKRRTAFPSHDGTADTFFSIPAYVHAKGTRVYGYVTADEAFNGTETIKFVPYAYRKHSANVQHPRRADDDTCLHCGQETRREGSGRFRVHVDTGEFLCDVEAYRRDGRGTHAEVRDTQEWRARTAVETQARGEG